MTITRHKMTLALGFFCALCAVSCVRQKLYRQEYANRESCEAREKVLLKELMDRKNETASLTRELGALNRQIGNQENEIRQIRAELISRTQQMGASSEKIAKEKAALEQDLNAAKALLEVQNAKLADIEKKQADRLRNLQNIANVLRNAYPDEESSGQRIEIRQDAVWLTLPEKTLFDPASANLSAAGQANLKSLAETLNLNPSLQAEIISHTDNAPPKAFKDTWDWSLARAIAVARSLVREHNTNANQLSPTGRGEFYPATSNDTPEGRLRNRRTEIRISLP